MKTHVLIVSVGFPAYHPRKNELTGFPEGIIQGWKLHTIRGNYDFWKKRVDQVNAGNAILSVRIWSGKPYNSKQKEITTFKKVGIQKCDVDIKKAIIIDGNVYKHIFQVEDIAKNDGLLLDEFTAWFKYPIKNGCVLHFTDLRY